MAVVIEQGLNKSVTTVDGSTAMHFRAGYNSNVLKWTHNTAKTLSRGEISINYDTQTFTFVDLVPINSKLEFDLLEVIKTLFGIFDDDKTYELSNLGFHDDNLSREVFIELKCIYTDTTSETGELQGLFTRSVMQHTDLLGTLLALYEANNVVNLSGNGSALALMRGGHKTIYPTIPRVDFSQKIRIFNGYPLDFSVISTPNNTILEHKLYYINDIFFDETTPTAIYTTGSYYWKWVKRIILSDGSNIIPIIQDNLSFIDNKGKLLITLSGDEQPSSYGLEFDVVDECGVYIKWLNSCGGWSYWLFNKNTRNLITTKAKGTINSNAGQLGYSADEKNIGFDSDEKLQVVTQGVEKWTLEQLLDIPTSPCVYLYMKPRGVWAYENGNSDVWLKLPTISNFKYSKKAESTLYNVGFEFQLPKIYTQTL